MLSGIVTLLLFTVTGNIISDALHLPIPGAVTGLVLLTAYLQLRSGPSEALEKVSQFCIRYLAVLFIPASVGLFFMTDLLAEQWLPIVLAVFVATPLSLLLTAWLLRLLFSINKRHSSDG